MQQVTRRDLMKHLGVTIGAAAAGAGALVTPRAAEAQAKVAPKGNIPSTPYKTGHMTFFTGPAVGSSASARSRRSRRTRRPAPTPT